MSELVRCGFGLGNRVAALANGLSRWPEIRFVWRDNAHCPAAHQDIFPRGIPGVEFVTDSPPASASRWDGIAAHAWAAAADRPLAAAAYAAILAAMDAPPAESPPTVAIIARFLRPRCTTASPAALAYQAARHAAGGRVFILADSRRQELADALARHGVAAVWPQCPELAADLARSRETMRAFVADWHTASLSAHVLGSPETSLAFPARAAGRWVTAGDA